MIKLLPKTFRWQIVTLLLGSLLISQIISAYIIIGERSLISINERIDKSIDSFFTLAELFINTPDYLHGELLLSVNNENTSFRLTDNEILTSNTIYDKKNTNLAKLRLDNYFKNTDQSIGSPKIIVTPSFDKDYLDIDLDYIKYISKYEHDLSSDNFFKLKPNHDRIDMEALLPSGQWLNATLVTQKLSLGLQIRLAAIIFITILIVSIISIFITLKLTKPIQDLTKAANKLGKGQNVKSLNESGSHDIKEALIAFNIMNKRLMKFISNQKEMLGAISHDLRSPLTSLRLRLETLNDSKNKEKMIHTVEEMNRMISSILTFIKQQADENTSEKSEIVNLYSFISSLADEYIDTGRNLELDYKLNKNLYFNCRYNSLRRALRNLIDNGLNYGTKVIVKVEINTHKNIIFYIMDNGPGVPEKFLNDVKKPFYRLDPSRNSDKGNIGMGLAISETITKSHGGVMNIKNQSKGGLVVTIEVPI